ncbi:MAG: hypothetical protein HKN89_08840 [Eudoraea sp.]|nr:hypothetical protein [Eudoraea sp.]
MNILIEAPYTVSDLDKSMIESKIRDLTKYKERITEATVFFKLGDGKGSESVISEIRLRIPGKDIFAGESDNTSNGAFVKAWNQVKKQLIKRKSILQEHR